MIPSAAARSRSAVRFHREGSPLAARVPADLPPADGLPAARAPAARRVLAGLLGGALALGLLAGCADSAPDVAETADPGTATLKFFEGEGACAALETHVESQAIAMMRAQLEGYAAFGSGGLPTAPVPVAAPGSTGAPAAPDSSASAGTAEGSSAAFSTTNVRTGGVDEPDPVKNDGEHLFNLRGRDDGVSLTKVSLRPASAMAVRAQVAWTSRETPEAAEGLYLVDASRLVALTSSGAAYFPMPLAAGDGIAAAQPMLCTPAGCGHGTGSTAPPSVRLRLVDAEDDALPTRWDLRFDGRLLGSRRIGDRIYVVTQSDLRLPDGVRWWPESAEGRQPVPMDDASWRAAIARLIETNARVIRDAPLSFWLQPLATGADTGLPAVPTARDCARFARVDASTRLAWLQVSTVDLATRTVAHQTTLADADTIYLSQRSLLLATPRWNAAAGGKVETFLHRFAIGADGSARYAASGRMDGTLINDYAINENAAGIVQVAASATADGQPHTYLATFGPAPGDSAQLVQLGRSDPIAIGERLQSARFVGDRVYFVTFRVVDPFFVYDLVDPARPRALGELKIPGFSSYLHPVGANHLLGIGYDGGGWPRRIKASLFDVTDPTRPLEQATRLLGSSYTQSEALWDPHAFTFYAPAGDADGGTMAIPIRSYHAPSYGTVDESGIRLLAVRPSLGAAALSLTGTLAMDDLRESAATGFGWRPADPRRAVFVGDTVYGIADGAVRAAPIAMPAAPLGTVRLP